MPPRKPLSSRAPPLSRRGGTAQDRTTVQPSPGLPPDPFDEVAELSEVDDAEAQATYQTGSAYPLTDEDDEDTGASAPSEVEDWDAPLGEAEDDGPPTSRYRAGEDIYGEDDPFPDEDPDLEDAAPERRKPTVGIPAVGAPEVTRVMAATEDAGPFEDDDPDDENATRAGPPIHLQVLAGPDAGRKKRFRGVRMVVGRGRGCDFQLQDNSVSRRHLELVLGDAGVLLRDLGSGNGTRVNDQKVDEHKLQDGDEVALGKTRFRFVDEVAAFERLKEDAETAEARESEDGAEEEASDPPDGDGDANDANADSDAPPQEKTQTRVQAPPARPGRARALRGLSGRSLQALTRQQKLLIGAAGGVILLLMVVVLAAGGQDAPPPPAVDPRVEQAALKMQQARTALAKGQFADAVALIEAAQVLGADEGAERLLEGARKEAAAQAALDEARVQVDRADFEGARATLAAMPLAVVVGEAAKDKAERELAEAELAYRSGEVQRAIDEGDLDTAQALYDGLPRERQLPLGPGLDALRTRLEKEARDEAARQREGARSRQRAQASARQREMDAAFENVQRRFDAGEWSRAALECDRVADQHRRDPEIRARAQKLKRLIPQFGRAFTEAQKKVSAGNLQAAAVPLQRARDLWRQLDLQGDLGPQLDAELAQASVAAGAAAGARRDWPSAARHYRQALSLDPTEAKAKEALQKLYSQAEEWYLQGYIIRDRDPRAAADKFRLVMDVLPKDRPTWEKAQTHLAGLTQ